MTDQPDWTAETPNVPLHEGRGQSQYVRPFTIQQLQEFGRILIEQFLQKVVQAVVGIFVPGAGSGFDQLASWANSVPVLGTIVQAITGVFGNLGDLEDFFNLANPVNLLSGLINGVVGGSGNPLSSLISSLLGTASTASTANTNATSALGNWTSLLAGIPGVSNIAGFLGFLQPTGSDRGIFGTLINGVVGGTTNPLSSLISSFLGTASTASTANSNATSALGNWSSLLAGIPGVSTVSGLLSFLQPTGSDRGIFGTLINGVAGGTTNPLSSLISSLTGTASTASTANTNASTALSNFTSLINGVVGGSGNPLSALIAFLGSGSGIPDSSVGGIGSILGNIFGAITGLATSGRTHTEMFDAASSQATTVTSTAAMAAQILAALGPGTPDADDFERTGSTIGTGWTAYHSGSGTMGTPNGHDLTWGGSVDDEWVAFRTTVLAASDTQSVQLVFSSSPDTSPVLLPSEFSKNDLWARCSNFASFAARTGVRLRFDTASNTLRLSSFNNGTETLMTQVTGMKRPVAGTLMALECGVGGNPRRFVGRLGGTAFIDWTEAGTTSFIGANYRRRGLGGRQENTLLATARPGGLKQWAAQG